MKSIFWTILRIEDTFWNDIRRPYKSIKLFGEVAELYRFSILTKLDNLVLRANVIFWKCSPNVLIWLTDFEIWLCFLQK